MIEIQPTASGTDLLAMLRYAHGVEATTIDEETSLTVGQTFIETLASIYKSKLDTTLRQGLWTDYQRVDRTVSYLRRRVREGRQLFVKVRLHSYHFPLGLSLRGVQII